MENFLINAFFIVVLILTIFTLNLNRKYIRMVCDMQEAYYAERLYTWNIIREDTGRDPAKEALNKNNPFLTEERYTSINCK